MMRFSRMLVCIALVGMLVAGPVVAVAAIIPAYWVLASLTVNGVSITPEEIMTATVTGPDVEVVAVAEAGIGTVPLWDYSFLGDFDNKFPTATPHECTYDFTLAPGESRDITIAIAWVIDGEPGTNIYTITITYIKPKPSGGGTSGEQPAPEAPGLEKATVGNCGQWASIHEGPGDAYGEIGRVHPGAEVELMRWDGTGAWCKVLYNGGTMRGGSPAGLSFRRSSGGGAWPRGDRGLYSTMRRMIG